MSSKFEPLPKQPTPKDLLPAYQKADMRSTYYHTKARALGDTVEAKSFCQAGEDQIDLMARIHSQIVHTRPEDLADVYAKLVVIMDSMSLRFRKEDGEMLEVRIMLEHVIDWLGAMVSCSDETEPVEIDSIDPLKSKEAA